MDFLLFAQETTDAVASGSTSFQPIDASELLYGSLKTAFSILKPLIIVMILIAAAKVLWAVFARKSKSRGSRRGWSARGDEFDGAPVGDYAYSRKPVMTPTERDFFERLYGAARANYWLFAKVSLHDVVRNNERAGWSKISQKHLDFVLCDPRDASVVLAIELDDWTHNRASAQKRDAQKDDVLESAGIPLLRVKVGNADEAMAAVRNKLNEIRRGA